MKRSSVWIRLSAELAVSESREFERRVLPLLRLNWPSMSQTTAQGRWDRNGIDLVVLPEEGPFPYVVQCKGFRVRAGELGADQLSQVEESVDRFIQSGLSCDEYYLIYNRDARQREFHQRMQAIVSRVCEKNRARTASVWDLETLLSNAQLFVKRRLDFSLREHFKKQLDRFQGLFEYGHCHIKCTPVEESLIVFKRGEPCSIDRVSQEQIRDVSELLLSPTEARWSLLIGGFGAGKTTAALRASLSQDHVVIYAQCRNFPASPELVSTNLLLEAIVQSLRVFSDCAADEELRMNELAGPVLANLLRQEESSYVLIIDGLDEHRFYSHILGMEILSNQIAELRCPIILTTREEHLSALFGDFSAAFEKFSTKHGPKRNARLFRLGYWQKAQTIELLTCAIAKSDGGRRENLVVLMSIIESGDSKRLYGDLTYSPLFLQFILEDVADSGIQESDRVHLLQRWVKRKLRRDREVATRQTLGMKFDMEEFVARMLRLMEDVAVHMTADDEAGLLLVETAEVGVVTDLAERYFPRASVSTLSILLNSLLSPAEMVQGRLTRVSFAFQILHEYFLASHLAREEQAADRYPELVRSLCEEIRR